MTRLSVVIWLLCCANALAQESPRGYVLKVGEGEEACCDVLIKASPRSGTQAGVMIFQPLPPDFSTGLHYHEEADEFFYVISGTGTATIAGQEYDIGPGDVIFVPAGEDHKLATNSEKMEILEFLDKPGLDEEFRAEIDEPLTLEKLNEIANRYGTVYKTLE